MSGATSFNTSKCIVIHFGKDNPKYKYYIRNGNTLTELTESVCERDLGVYVDNQLKFDSHILNKTKQARKVCGMINRTVSFKTKEIMVPLFKTLVRPVVEYAKAVWCPYKRKDINEIEKIQRHFTRCIVGMRELDYSQRLRKLDLPSLEFRRVRGDMLECFEFVHNFYDPLTTNNLITHSANTRPNPFKITKQRALHNPYQYFFTNRIVNLWNQLPSVVVNAKSINSFKNKIDKILSPIKFSTKIDTINYKINDRNRT